MKKAVGTALLALLSIVVTQAQQTNFGLKLGYNSSSVEIDNGTDFDAKSGFHVGGLAHVHLTDQWAVQPEVVYSMQGGERPNNKLKLNYINVPVLAQYMFRGGFRLQTGPQLGFLVSAEQELNDVEFDVDDSFDGIDFSWSFGAGYLSSSGLGIDFRYNLGVSNISDDNDFEASNRVIQLGVFWQFRNNAGRRK
jgi:hypothetical protein